MNASTNSTPSTSALASLPLEELQELFQAHQELQTLEDRNRLDNLKLTRTQRDFLLDPSEIKLFSGGNGSGKSAILVIDATLQMLGEHPLQITGEIAKPPIFVRAMSPTLADTVDKVVRPEFMKWIRGDLFDRYDSKHRILYLKNGSKVEFMSNDQDIAAFGGGDRSILLCDEPPEHTRFDESTARLREAQGRTLIGFTPVRTNPNIRWLFLDLIEQGKCSTYYGDCMELLKLRFGSKGAEEVFARMSANWSKEDMLVRRYGKFPVLEGLVWDFKKSAPPKGHVIDDVKIENDWMIVMSMDYHPRTAIHCLWKAILPSGVGYYFKEYESQPGQTDIEIAADIARIEEKFPSRVSRRLIDPSSSHSPNRNEEFATPVRNFAKCRSRGEKIYFQNAIRNKEYGLNCVAEKLRFDPQGRSGIYFFKSLTTCIDQITHYIFGEWMHSTDMKNAQQEPLKKDDHHPDNVRYIEAQKFKYTHPRVKELREAYRRHRPRE